MTLINRAHRSHCAGGGVLEANDTWTGRGKGGPCFGRIQHSTGPMMFNDRHPLDLNGKGPRKRCTGAVEKAVAAEL